MATNTELIQITQNHQPIDAESLVGMLEGSCGNIKTFLDKLPKTFKESGDDELIIGTIEHWLQKLDDKSFLRRWRAAIHSNAVLRLRLLQNKALERMELLANEQKWAELAKEKMGFQLILASVLAGETHKSKQAPEKVEEPADEEDDSEEAMNY